MFNIVANNVFGYDLILGQIFLSILNIKHRNKNKLREIFIADTLTPINLKQADLVQQLDSGNITIKDAINKGI